jgi:hypothetical protein
VEAFAAAVEREPADLHRTLVYFLLQDHPKAIIREALRRPGPERKTTIFHEAAEKGSGQFILEMVEVAKDYNIW